MDILLNICLNISGDFSFVCNEYNAWKCGKLYELSREFRVCLKINWFLIFMGFDSFIFEILSKLKEFYENWFDFKI